MPIPKGIKLKKKKKYRDDLYKTSIYPNVFDDGLITEAERQMVYISRGDE